MDRRPPAAIPVRPASELHLDGPVVAGGDVIARPAGRPLVMVEGGLPGERVRAAVTGEHRDYSLAVAVEVLEAHPERRAPPCPHVAEGCGGCQWQQAGEALQRRMKEQVVLDALRRIAHLPDPPAPATVELPPWGYRTTARLAVDGRGRPAYQRRHGHEHVPVDSCPIAHPRLAALIAGCRLPGARRVTLRVTDTEAVVAADRRPRPRWEVPDGALLAGPGDPGRIHPEVGGRPWRVSKGSFFQAGPAAAGAIAGAVDAVLGDLGPGGVLVDLYAGVGLLGGLAAARRRCRLVAVEAERPAAADARVNLTALDATVAAVEVSRWSAEPAGAVIADPARPGLGRPGVAAVDATGASRLGLVSCDAASFARDTALLEAGGWGLRSVTLVDAFPQTVHVEIVSGFERR